MLELDCSMDLQRLWIGDTRHIDATAEVG